MNTTGVKGKYKLIIHKGDETKPTRVVDWFDNLITNQGLDYLGAITSSPIYQYCKVGSGSVTPAFTDVGLVSPLATKDISAITHGFTTVAPFYSWKRMEYLFSPGNATGNISEISIGWDSNNVSAFSRALITEEGNPITLTILEDDFLTVYYELRLYPNLTDVTGSVTIGGVNHTFTGRAAGVGAGSWGGSGIGQSTIGKMYATRVLDGSLGTVYASPSFTEGITIWGASVSTPYVNGNYYRDETFTYNTTQANLVNFIKSIVLFAQESAFQFEFTPPIEKSVNNTLSLTFRYSWARYVE